MSPKVAYGTSGGSNFYLGKNLGLTGADRNFSSYISNKKVPVDMTNFEEEEDEDMDNTILENRVYREGKYCLVETLNNLLDNKDDDVDEDEELEEFSGVAVIVTGKQDSIYLPCRPCFLK